MGVKKKQGKERKQDMPHERKNEKWFGKLSAGMNYAATPLLIDPAQTFSFLLHLYKGIIILLNPPRPPGTPPYR